MLSRIEKLRQLRARHHSRLEQTHVESPQSEYKTSAKPNELQANARRKERLVVASA